MKSIRPLVQLALLVNLLFGHNLRASCNCNAPCYCWTGWYVGLNGGYCWSTHTVSIDPLPNAARFINLSPSRLDLHPTGGFGGAQFGYNCQSTCSLIGWEADFSGGSISDTVKKTPIIQNNGTPLPGGGFLTARQRTHCFGTVRLRLGYTLNNVLIYGTAGLGFAHVKYLADSDFRPTGGEHYPISFTRTNVGWAVSAGFEYGFCTRWSFRIEYLVYDIGKVSKIANPSPSLPPLQIRYKFDNQNDLLRIGFNYRI